MSILGNGVYSLPEAAKLTGLNRNRLVSGSAGALRPIAQADLSWRLSAGIRR